MILNDKQISSLIQNDLPGLLKDFDAPSDWFSKGSLVQPSSLDLHIGGIYVPGVRPGQSGSAGHPKSELVLRTGQTAIVTTQETIHLSSGHAAFGFPPSHVSARALLMTNPGHVDPGYQGKLRFTVINMARNDYVLRGRDLIVTLLLFRLEAAAQADYAKRGGSTPGADITQHDIDQLSPDFVDVSRRAGRIAKRTLAITTVGSSIIALVLSWAFNAIDRRVEGIDDLRIQLARAEDNNADLARRLDTAREVLQKQIELDHRLTVLESTSVRSAERK